MFALTMASEDEQLQQLWTTVDRLSADIQLAHERIDSSMTLANDRFEQHDLAETATKSMIDTIMGRLDAMHTAITEL